MEKATGFIFKGGKIIKGFDESDKGDDIWDNSEWFLRSL